MNRKPEGSVYTIKNTLFLILLNLIAFVISYNSFTSERNNDATHIASVLFPLTLLGTVALYYAEKNV
jgi:hypothetical protein